MGGVGEGGRSFCLSPRSCVSTARHERGQLTPPPPPPPPPPGPGPALLAVQNALAAIEADESSIAEAIAGMNEIEAVVSEVLRIYTASITVRRASAAFQLGVGSSGVTVRKGDTVVVAPVLTHHDPEIYPEPDIFRPARMRRDSAGRRPAVQKGTRPSQTRVFHARE